MANNIVNPNRRIPITALLLCICMAHAATGTAQPETQTASETAAPKQEMSYSVDKAKIARNMAAWDKLMEKKKYPRNQLNKKFIKNAVPLKKFMYISNKNIKSIEIFYMGSGWLIENKMLRFSDVSAYSGFSKDLSSGKADLSVPPEQFKDVVRMLNNIRTWRYSNHDLEIYQNDHRLAIFIRYADGRILAIGTNARNGYDNYLQAMLTQDIAASKKSGKYHYALLSFRDMTVLIQHINSSIPIFLFPEDLNKWKELTNGSK